MFGGKNSKIKRAIKKNRKEEGKAGLKKKKKPLLGGFSFGIGKERNYFVENLSMLIGSGMSVVTALEAIKKELRNKKMISSVESICSDIEAGASISRALDDSKIFPDYTIALVKVGEETGRLTENLKIIAQQEQKEAMLRSKIKSAMMYPVAVLFLGVVIGLGISWFILPRLATVFSRMGIELPMVTKILIAIGGFLSEYGKVAVPLILLAFGALVYYIFFYSKTKYIGQAILFKIPGIKKLIRETEIARFGFLLGTLLKAGMPVVTAMNSLQNATTFLAYKKMYGYIKSEVEDGSSFEKSFHSYDKSKRYIPSTVQQMIFSGEKSGVLPEVLKKIGSIYENKAEITTRNLTVLLEPVMLIIIWLGVVAVALAVILPIYSLIGGIKQPKKVTTANSTQKVVEIREIPEELGGMGFDDIATDVEELPENMLEILETSVGFLNVRTSASLEAEAIGKVYEGDVYEYINEQDGWYEIVLEPLNDRLEEQQDKFDELDNFDLLSNEEEDQDEELSDDEQIEDDEFDPTDFSQGWVFGEFVTIFDQEKNEDSSSAETQQ